MEDKVHTLHTSAQTRNSNIKRVRTWMLTLNNYMDAEVKQLQNIADCKYVFQEEKGKEKGTPHLQGYFKFKQPKTLAAMKKINGRAHWEAAKNEFAVKEYCHKIDTRNGKIYANIKLGDKAQSALHIDPQLEKYKNNFTIWKMEMIEEAIQETIKNIETDQRIQQLLNYYHLC